MLTGAIADLFALTYYYFVARRAGAIILFVIPVLWAALVSFIVVDPLTSTRIGVKGIELWHRHTKS